VATGALGGQAAAVLLRAIDPADPAGNS
jgi:hypothetical protein